MRKISWLIFMVFCCSCAENQKVNVDFVLGNDSYERQKIDIKIKLDDKLISDTLYYHQTLYKNLYINKGIHKIGIESVIGNVNYETDIRIDSTSFVDIRYTFGLSEDVINTLKLVKKNVGLDTAILEVSKDETKPRIILRKAYKPFQYK